MQRMDSFDKDKELARLRALFTESTDFLQAIGDASRQQILLAIMQGAFGGSRVGEIAQRAHLSEPVVTHHIRILKNAGIVLCNRIGTRNYYYISAGCEAFQKAKHLMDVYGAVADDFRAIQTYGEE